MGVVAEAEVVPDPGGQHGVDNDVGNPLDVDEAIVSRLVQHYSQIRMVNQPLLQNELSSAGENNPIFWWPAISRNRRHWCIQLYFG